MLILPSASGGTGDIIIVVNLIITIRVFAPTGDASLRTLNLSANNIGDRGAAALAEMLKVSVFTSLLRVCILLLTVWTHNHFAASPPLSSLLDWQMMSGFLHVHDLSCLFLIISAFRVLVHILLPSIEVPQLVWNCCSGEHNADSS